jgi:hypothetical protein
MTQRLDCCERQCCSLVIEDKCAPNHGVHRLKFST